MIRTLFLLLITLIINYTAGTYSSKDLKCLVCRTVVEEMEKEIAKVNPNRKIKVGGYRVDGDGNAQEKYIPLARSQMHLSEVMDNICEKMDDYVRATSKASGELMLVKLMSDEGGMNPIISEVDIVQDSDLNKSLKFHCEGILEEFEEDFFKVLNVESENADIALCGKAAQLCDLEESVDYNFENDEL